ncbi:hypothetical protein BKA70DRAFT_1381173 [Coprinopsis sp. MPI-PUGE-AT-0042]|nr:hypothetical protein BKA70DRAFT_1381173 [Coprinopsis sp. MPI-PUGE-AT-0042]
MSVFRQILGAAAASGRTGGRAGTTACTRRAGYSSFSGRYFNSSGKPGSKGPVVAAKSSNTKAKELQPAPQDGTDLVDNTTGDTIADSTSASCTTTSTSTTITNTSTTCTTSPDTPLSPLHTGQQPNIHLVIEPDFASIQSSTHPVITPQELKLHQFFSLHRPLLLIHTPPALFDAPPVTTFATSQPEQQPRQLMSIFDDPVDAKGIDPDVEAARQLARGLTINKAGPAVAWEQTLKRLGLDPAAEPERVEMQGQMDRDWEDVQILMDSTKRKRRSKMKKHKLKKRRKATRASRLKLK